jgi:phosphonate transport system substrate-binding protein
MLSPDGGVNVRGSRGLLFLFVLLCALTGLLRDALAADGRGAPGAARLDADTLHLGIAPFHSTLTLLRIHRPLRDHLACVLKMKVMVYSAFNHEQFLDNAVSGYFDVLVTPAHFLPMLSDAGFIPLVRYRNPFELLLVVRKDSDISGVDDLRGKRIGLPDRLSFYYTVGLHWLGTLNLQAGTDYVLDEYSSHMAELLAVDTRQLDVAVTGRSPWMLISPNVRDRLRAIDTGHPSLPSMTTMARRNLGAAQIERIRAALLSFPQSEDGKRFFTSTGYGGYVVSTDADVEAGRAYETRVRRLWQFPRVQEPIVGIPSAREMASAADNAVKPCLPLPARTP